MQCAHSVHVACCKEQGYKALVGRVSIAAFADNGYHSKFALVVVSCVCLKEAYTLILSYEDLKMTCLDSAGSARQICYRQTKKLGVVSLWYL